MQWASFSGVYSDLLLASERFPSDRLGLVFLRYTCLCLYISLFVTMFSFFLCLNTFFIPGPVLASTTCAQSLVVFGGSFFHLLTISTQALHISPLRASASLKHLVQSSSYFLLSVKRELLDFALHMQQPSWDLYSLGL